MQKIIDDESEVQEGEEKLAALTAGDRVSWAMCRQEFFAKGINRVSLAAIEGAVFFVSLDDVDYNYNPVIIFFFLSINLTYIKDLDLFYWRLDIWFDFRL